MKQSLREEKRDLIIQGGVEGRALCEEKDAERIEKLQVTVVTEDLWA